MNRWPPDAGAKRLAAAVLFAIAALIHAAPVAANVTVEPHFQNLTVLGDRIVVSSVDGRRLIALDRAGHKLWERRFNARVSVGEIDADNLYVQDGRTLLRMNTATGEGTPMSQLPEHQILSWSPDQDFATSADDRFDVQRVQVLDPKSLRVLWSAEDIQSIETVTSKTVVAVTAQRSYERDRHGYRLSHAALVGRDRLTGAQRWTIPLKNSQAVGVRGAMVGTYLVVLDDPFTGGRLLCLDPDSGQVLGQVEGGTDWASGRSFLHLAPDEGAVAYIDRTLTSDEVTLHVASVPDLKEKKQVKLSAKEILKFWLVGDTVLTAGIYDSASFDRATGKRHWEKGAIGEWTPFGDAMLATDTADKGSRARVITIDLRTGETHELYSEAISAEERKAFQPW